MAYKSRFLYIDDNGDVQEGMSAGVFITNVQSVNPSDVVSITWKSGVISGFVVESIETNTEDLIVTVEWDGTAYDWNGSVSINGVVVSGITEIGETRRFRGSATIDLNGSLSILALHTDGAGMSVPIVLQGIGPEITDIQFIGGYPGTQTEVKNNDVFQVQITFNPAGSEPSHFIMSDFGACKAGTFDLSTTELNWGTVHTATITAIIDYTSLVATPLTCRGRARNSFGTYGDYVDSSNTVVCNDITPSFVDNGVTFPSGQLAFKDNEAGSQDTTVNNFTSLLYASVTGEFLISNNTTYEQNKAITCTNPNTYNDSTTNFSIVANRSQNATSATFNKNIEVADTAPLITVTQPQTRLRTSPLGTAYTITSTSNQHIANSPTLSIGIPVSGIWNGAGWVGTTKIKTRAINIIDGDAVGIGAWFFDGAVPTNRAGIAATITGNENVGGFTSRDVELAAFGTQVIVPVEVVDIAKLTLSWSFKTPMLYQAIGTPPPVVSGWTINATGVNPTTFIILDTSACAASSQESILTLGENI